MHKSGFAFGDILALIGQISIILVLDPSFEGLSQLTPCCHGPRADPAGTQPDRSAKAEYASELRESGWQPLGAGQRIGKRQSETNPAPEYRVPDSRQSSG